MAKRRKVGNLLALAILGTLVQRPMHPYEMASILRARNKDEDMPIKWGSLYTVVQNLEKHGLIAEMESERAGGRPERTIYSVTPEGVAELKDWVRELLGTPEREHVKFTTALSMIGALDPDEAVELLEHRLELINVRIARDRAAYEHYVRDLPRLFLIEAEYELATMQAEVRWIEGLLREFESGTFPDLDGWRSYARTGVIPEEYRKLAERGTPEE
jgi:DNA-binding PadR family transcriptional regulator